MKLKISKPLIVAGLILLAIVSCLYLADWASDPKTHQATITEIDEKVETVLALTASATGVAVLVSMLPNDMGTPVAENISDIAMFFAIVLCALYAEKYLVTIMGLATFRILIPLALIVFGVSLFWKPEKLRQIAVKLIVIGLAVFLVIPASVKVSKMIDQAYDFSLQKTVSVAEELREEGEEAKESGIFGGLKEVVEKFRNKAITLLNRLIQSFAVMMVTSCLIPLLVLLFFLWVIKQFTGVDLAEKFSAAYKAGKAKTRSRKAQYDNEE